MYRYCLLSIFSHWLSLVSTSLAALVVPTQLHSISLLASIHTLLLRKCQLIDNIHSIHTALSIGLGCSKAHVNTPLALFAGARDG